MRASYKERLRLNNPDSCLDIMILNTRSVPTTAMLTGDGGSVKIMRTNSFASKVDFAGKEFRVLFV